MDVSSDDGVIKVDQTAPPSYPFTYTFESGTSVSLMALPDVGCQFDGWSGDLSGTAITHSILMDCNKSVSASFSPATYTKMNETLVGGIAGVIIVLGLILAVWMSRRRA